MLEYEKKKLEAFKKFLANFEKFLNEKAVIKNTKVQVLYLHEPHEPTDIYFSRGVVQVGSLEYPIEVKFDTVDDLITIKSEIFYYKLLTEEMIEFINKLR
jgi:hypothetical protein